MLLTKAIPQLKMPVLKTHWLFIDFSICAQTEEQEFLMSALEWLSEGTSNAKPNTKLDG